MTTKNISKLPVLPLRNTVVFPGVSLPLRVGRKRSIAAVERAQLDGGYLLLVALREGDEEEFTDAAHLHRVGTIAKIEKVRGTKDSGFQVIVRGEQRFHTDAYRDEGDVIVAEGSAWDELSDVDEKVALALLDSLKTMSTEILGLLPTDTSQLVELIKGIDDLSYLSYLCAANLEGTIEEKQVLLEQRSLKARVLKLLELMQHHKEALQVQSEIRDRLSSKLGKVQRESILRQQLDAIREELGEKEEKDVGDTFRKKIDEAQMPEEVRKVALDELKRLESIGNSSPESHVIRNYLDLLCAMPWSKSAPENIDLENASSVLEKDHYGLEKIKKRIVEHLAVMKLKKDAKGSILLFVGPPGVGKTSLGNSIATALGRSFVRVSLGGLRDDAEIRGHRRTYVGALPGRIIQGIKRAGQNNPVMMLDEIDKLARGFQGDPASALLEVLDPEQNANFVDHYLDVAFDLSKVVFIATANSLETIPAPLLDRMEVIELSGYTTAEKLHIAKRHLIPKQLEAHGLRSEQVTVPDEAVIRLITHYTREAGVRSLQRLIGSLCRHSAEKVIRHGLDTNVAIDTKVIEEILGPEKYVYEVAERLAAPGIVTGLAWTPQGGEILFIEASLMPGSGKMTLTGQLGEVMKESAQIALTLVRSNLPSLVPGFEYDKRDLHIHVPSGAIPKDGPSAGVAMTTTIASLFSGRRVDPRLAMTGEITLRGAVMPVGGVKEKVIAAHRAGIERVILPSRNERDLRDVPEEVRANLKFIFVDHISQVIREALSLEIENVSGGWQAPPPPAAPIIA